MTIHQRAETGTTGANKARREGRIPGALYGHGEAEAIAVDARTLNELLAGGGHSHIVEATIDGKKESVLLREVQRDPISHRPIAADFQRVSSTEAIYASVAHRHGRRCAGRQRSGRRDGHRHPLARGQGPGR